MRLAWPDGAEGTPALANSQGSEHRRRLIADRVKDISQSGRCFLDQLDDVRVAIVESIVCA